MNSREIVNEMRSMLRELGGQERTAGTDSGFLERKREEFSEFLKQVCHEGVKTYNAQDPTCQIIEEFFVISVDFKKMEISAVARFLYEGSEPESMGLCAAILLIEIGTILGYIINQLFVEKCIPFKFDSVQIPESYYGNKTLKSLFEYLNRPPKN